MHGQFVLSLCGAEEKTLEVVLPNTVVDQGAKAIMQMFLQGAAGSPVSGGAFYLGLCSGSVSQGMTLSNITGEPSTGVGYARKGVSRSSVGWPGVPVAVNNMWSLQSTTQTFTTSTTFNTAITRIFLSDASSGTVGTLYAISAPLINPLTIDNAHSLAASYKFFMP